MTTLIEHLEKYCGPIMEGWKSDPIRGSVAFQVVRLREGPIAESVTLSTLGLSNWRLKSPRSSKFIRHEFIVLQRADAEPKNLLPILEQIGLEAVASGRAYLRGDVIGPRGPLFAGSQFDALYVSMPAYFPEQFSSVLTEKIGSVIFAWLVPITRREATYVATAGWTQFEEKLAQENPDLLDPLRKSVV